MASTPKRSLLGNVVFNEVVPCVVGYGAIRMSVGESLEFYLVT